MLNKQFGLRILPLVLTIVAACAVTFQYVICNGLFLFGLFGFVYVVYKSPKVSHRHYRFFFLFVFALLIALATASQSLVYLAAIAAICFSIEMQFRRVPLLAYILLVIISPISYYFFESFGFEIKLHITQSVAALLHTVNDTVRAQGNTVLINGNRFSIDTACMGLRMTGYAFTLCLLLFFRYLQNRRYSFVLLLSAMVLTVALNVLANFSRIVLLIVFQILPDNPLHYIIGLLCFIVYNALPLLLLFPVVSKRIKEKTLHNPLSICSMGKRLTLQFVAIALLLAAGVYVQYSSVSTNYIENIPANYTKITLKNGTLQVFKKDIVVYIKPIQSFLSSEHTPALCWIGSGYEINYIDRLLINNHPVFYGTLCRNKTTLHTAWWIVCGNSRSINQKEWRMALFLHQQSCCLINVTASSQQQLNAAIEEFWPVSY